MVERRAIHARAVGDGCFGDPQHQQGRDLLLFPVQLGLAQPPSWPSQRLPGRFDRGQRFGGPQGEQGPLALRQQANRVTRTVVCRSCVPVRRRPSVRANTRIWYVTKVSRRGRIAPTERPSRLHARTRSVSPGTRRASTRSTCRGVADRRAEAWRSSNSSTAIRSVLTFRPARLTSHF